MLQTSLGYKGISVPAATWQPHNLYWIANGKSESLEFNYTCTSSSGVAHLDNISFTAGGLYSNKTLATGSNLVTNGNFTKTYTSWMQTKGAGTQPAFSTSSTAAIATFSGSGNAYLSQVLPTVAGKVYRITWSYSVSNLGSGTSCYLYTLWGKPPTGNSAGQFPYGTQSVSVMGPFTANSKSYDSVSQVVAGLFGSDSITFELQCNGTGAISLTGVQAVPISA